MKFDQNITKLLDGVSATGAGRSIGNGSLHRGYQVLISGTATVSLEASLDGENWETLRSSTSSEMYSTAEPWVFVRGNVTAYTSGTVTLLMAN